MHNHSTLNTILSAAYIVVILLFIGVYRDKTKNKK